MREKSPHFLPFLAVVTSVLKLSRAWCLDLCGPDPVSVCDPAKFRQVAFFLARGFRYTVYRMLGALTWFQ